MQAPELHGDHWFNSEPVSLRAQQGEMVILFFWDSVTVSSGRIVELIKEWHAQYAERGVVFVGIHGSEFTFAQKSKTIAAALQKHSIPFPVVSDTEGVIANAYRISAFPSIVLVDASGTIYDSVSQNFSVMRLERSIQYLLRQSGFFGELPELRLFENESSIHQNVPEVSTGYRNGSLGNSEGYSPELPARYEDPEIYTAGKFYAHGIWRAEKNSFLYEGEPNEGYLICQSTRDNIDAVIGSDAKKDVRILVDGSPIPIANMGHDVRRDAKGNAFVSVLDPQIHSIFRKSDEETHTIKMIPASSGVSFYLFLFEKIEIGTAMNESVRNN